MIVQMDKPVRQICAVVQLLQAVVLHHHLLLEVLVVHQVKSHVMVVVLLEIAVQMQTVLVDKLVHQICVVVQRHHHRLVQLQPLQAVALQHLRVEWESVSAVYLNVQMASMFVVTTQQNQIKFALTVLVRHSVVIIQVVEIVKM